MTKKVCNSRVILMLVMMVIVSYISTGCGKEASRNKEDFALRLSALSDNPEDVVDVDLSYSTIDDCEEAFTILYCYVSDNDGNYTQNQAEDAWIYLSHYIDALESEFGSIYIDYCDIYE